MNKLFHLSSNLLKLFSILISIFYLNACFLNAQIKDLSEKSASAESSPVSSSPDGSLTITAMSSYIVANNQGSFSFSGTCKIEGSKIEVLINSVVQSPSTSCGSGGGWALSLNLVSILETSHNFEARINGAGTTNSINIIKDVTSPDVSGISFNDGSFYNSLIQSPNITWIAAVESGSGIEKYEVAIGTSAGSTDILNWTSVGTGLNYQATGLTLTNGNTYYASLRATDKAGNISTVIQGDGWVVDSNVPVGPSSFLDGVIGFSLTDSPVLSWLAGSDGQSGVQGYQVAIGTSQGGSDIISWTSVGNVFTNFFNTLSLQGSRRYYASIRTMDQAGNPSNQIDGDGWWNLQQQKLAVDNTNPQVRWMSESALFGSSVAISEDQSTMVIGAPNDSLDATGGSYMLYAGAAFVYTKVAGVWTLQQKLVATGTNARVSQDKFGTSVAISGNTIVVGAHQHDYDENGANSVLGSGAAYVFTRSGVVWSQQQKLVGTGTNGRIGNDNFGYSVSISGDSIAVGAYRQYYDENGANAITNAGAAYVFTRSGVVWSQQQKLVGTGANGRVANDNFGYSVSISGDSIVVGAYRQDYDENGANFLTDAGAAYVFTRSGVVWTQQQKLVGTGANGRVASDAFGTSVSISGDSIVVGANGQDYDESGANLISAAGAAYVFTRSGLVWSQQQKLVGTGANGRVASDAFGTSVSISGDSIVVGANQQGYDASGANFILSAGSAYIETRSAGVWTQEQKVVDTVVPQSRVDLASGVYGQSVAISEDGQTMVVGASADRTDASGNNPVLYAGAAYVYVKVAGVWELQQKLVASGTNARMSYDYFGIGVAISGDTIVVGAYHQDYDENGANSLMDAGAAYVFTRSGGVWSQQQKLVGTGTNARLALDNFGYSVTVSGDTIAIGALWQDYDENGANSQMDAGAAYVFTRSGGVWSQQQKLVGLGTNARNSNNYFGYSISIWNDTVAVGAWNQGYDVSGGAYLANAGAVYIYTRTAGVWSQQQKLTGMGTNGRLSGDGFGGSVSLYQDSLIVGADGQDYDESGASNLSGAGAAFVFTRTAGVWSLQQKIVGTGTNGRVASDRFGNSVSISGDSIIVGAYNQDHDISGSNSSTDAGASYVFTRTSGVWTQQQKLVGTGTNARNAADQFGNSVAISENGVSDGYTIVIGASGQQFNSTGTNPVNGAGAVYVFY